jgi:hypothetical protein
MKTSTILPKNNSMLHAPVFTRFTPPKNGTSTSTARSRVAIPNHWSRKRHSRQSITLFLQGNTDTHHTCTTGLELISSTAKRTSPSKVRLTNPVQRFLLRDAKPPVRRLLVQSPSVVRKRNLCNSNLVPLFDSYTSLNFDNSPTQQYIVSLKL